MHTRKEARECTWGWNLYHAAQAGPKGYLEFDKKQARGICCWGILMAGMFGLVADCMLWQLRRTLLFLMACVLIRWCWNQAWWPFDPPWSWKVGAVRMVDLGYSPVHGLGYWVYGMGFPCKGKLKGWNQLRMMTPRSQNFPCWRPGKRKYRISQFKILHMDETWTDSQKAEGHETNSLIPTPYCSLQVCILYIKMHKY